jgi:hypothetical protein
MNKVSKSLKKFSIFVLVLILSVGVLPGVSDAERSAPVNEYIKIPNGVNIFSSTIDLSGNIYLTGSFSFTSDFDFSEGVDEYTNVGNNGNGDFFLTKINTDGSYGWTKTMGGASVQEARGVDTDSSGNVYISGYFSGTVDFNPGIDTDEYTSSSGGNAYNAFITKINADGTYGYTKIIVGLGGGYVQSFSLVIDSSNDALYISGYFSSAADFDPSGATEEHTSNGSTDVFLSKFNIDGSYVWTKTMGDTQNDESYSLAIDENGNIYIAGWFQSNTIDFDPDVGTDEHTNNGNYDIFLTKINSDGSYGWTQTIGGSNIDYAQSISADFEGNVYITGEIDSASIDFDSGEGEDIYTTNGLGDMFLTKFNVDGSYGYTKVIIGDDYDYGSSVTTDLNGNIYMVGYFQSDNIDFDPGLNEDIHDYESSCGSSLTKFKSDGSYDYTITPIDLCNAWNMFIDNNNNVFTFGFGLFTKFSQSTYHHIDSLSGTLVAETTGGTSVDDEEVDDGILEDEVATVRVKDDTLPLADIDTTFSADLDWSSITGDSDTTNYKSFVHNLTIVDGADDTYTLYVPHRRGDTSVAVCPGATSLEIVTDSCENVVTYREGVSDVSVVTINDTNFWSIPNQTGTGGISLPPVRRSSGSTPRSTVAFVPSTPSTNSGQAIPETPKVPTCTLTLLLKQGSRGEEVKCLQTLLNQNLVLDGMFGPKTKASVILFQKAHNLVPDGIVGPLTREKLNS